MWLLIWVTLTVITVFIISRKWRIPIIIATFMGAIYIGIDSELTKLENGSWTCQPTSTFPINPQSRILCAPEGGMINHWRFGKYTDVNDDGSRKTTRYVTINAQQGAQYLSIYDRSVKLYKSCMYGSGIMGNVAKRTGFLYSGRARHNNIGDCKANYFDRGLYTVDDVEDLQAVLGEELRVFYRQFPIISDKRPRWWIDLQ
jgi:hypothetical protein